MIIWQTKNWRCKANLISEKISRVVADVIHIEGAPVFVHSFAFSSVFQSMNWKYSIGHDKLLANTGHDGSILL